MLLSYEEKKNAIRFVTILYILSNACTRAQHVLSYYLIYKKYHNIDVSMLRSEFWYVLLDVRCVILSACFHTEIFDEDIDLSDINVVAKAPSLSIYLRPIQKS